MTVNSDVATLDPAIERNAQLSVLVLNGPTRTARDKPSGNVSDDRARARSTLFKPSGCVAALNWSPREMSE